MTKMNHFLWITHQTILQDPLELDERELMSGKYLILEINGHRKQNQSDHQPLCNKNEKNDENEKNDKNKKGEMLQDYVIIILLEYFWKLQAKLPVMLFIHPHTTSAHAARTQADRSALVFSCARRVPTAARGPATCPCPAAPARPCARTKSTSTLPEARPTPSVARKTGERLRAAGAPPSTFQAKVPGNGALCLSEPRPLPLKVAELDAQRARQQKVARIDVAVDQEEGLASARNSSNP